MKIMESLPKMNLPIRALYEIRAFSRPVTRPDWRTCKKAECSAMVVRLAERAFDTAHLEYQANNMVWSPVLHNDVRKKIYTEDVKKVIAIFMNYTEAAVATRKAQLDLYHIPIGGTPEQNAEYESCKIRLGAAMERRNQYTNELWGALYHDFDSDSDSDNDNQ